MGEAAEIQSETAFDGVAGAEAIELGRYFRWGEADIGFRSNFGAMEHQLIIGGGPPSFDEAPDPHASRIGNHMLATTSTTLVWRALKRLDERGGGVYVIALYRLYGPWFPSDNPWRKEFKDLAPLLTMTDAAEDARADLAAKRADDEGERTTLKLVQGPDQGAEHFWRMAPRWTQVAEEWEALRKRHKDPKTPVEEREKIARRARVLATERSALRKNLMAQVVPVRATAEMGVRARISHCQSCDRATTVHDAVALGLEGDAPARHAFAVALRREAVALRKSAHLSYRDARADVAC